MTAPLSPPLCPPAAEAEARDGFAPAEATPLHRSAVALRVEAAGAALLAEERALLLLVAAGADRVAFAGAVELLNTDWPPARVTPAVEPLTRAATGLRAAFAGARLADDGVRCA